MLEFALFCHKSPKEFALVSGLDFGLLGAGLVHGFRYRLVLQAFWSEFMLDRACLHVAMC